MKAIVHDKYGSSKSVRIRLLNQHLERADGEATAKVGNMYGGDGGIDPGWLGDGHGLSDRLRDMLAWHRVVWA